MFALFGATFTAVGSAYGRHCNFNIRFSAATAGAAGWLLASLSSTVALAGGDPADPTAKVAGIGYRSTIAPYTRLRPTAPASWRERNDSVAPKPDRQERTK